MPFSFGRDDIVIFKSLLEVESFLRQLSLKPIILHKKASEGSSIIEKIEGYSDVDYAVILYTDCDLGKGKSESVYKPRARQNVVFEHGYMIAKLGRSRVCALKVEGVEIPGDMSGVVYIPLDSAGAWKMKLAQELQKKVDIDKDAFFEDC